MLPHSVLLSRRVGNSYSRLLPAPTSTHHIQCRRPSPGSLCSLRQIGAFGLRSALRFAGLLTEEATVTATCFRVFDSDQGCTMHKLAKTQIVSPLPHPRTSFRKLHLVSRGSRDRDSFYRDSMDQCNLWTLDRVDIFPICIMFSFSSAKLLLLLSLK